MELLTEEEVAVLLRCSCAKVKRLRLSGAMAYLPGRPPLILRDDLNAYIEGARRKAAKKRGPETGTLEAQQQASEEIRLRATRDWLRHRMKQTSR
ncbi:helix-turn-helix domain-containing protein [Xanthobacter flavus]|uniref:helix-turn-helix domain-containing protein n=1 Tax=Xanthobacter flavus TaxID=281 RepID=UPI00372D70E8